MLKPHLVFGVCVFPAAIKSSVFFLDKGPSFSGFICVVWPSLEPCSTMCSALLLLYAVVTGADIASNSDAVIVLDTTPVTDVDIAAAFPLYMSSVTVEDIASVNGVAVCAGISSVPGVDIDSDECVGDCGPTCEQNNRKLIKGKVHTRFERRQLLSTER